MYNKKVVDDLPGGAVADVVITSQESWFMNVARRFHVWFPSGQTQYGLSPAKYVAYYETQDRANENPKQIAYIAKVVTYWNRITLDEAKQIPELRRLFADTEVAAEISGWPGNDGTFHISLTEKPVRLRRPIPLGKLNYARVLSRRRVSLPDLVNATTVDDFFA